MSRTVYKEIVMSIDRPIVQFFGYKKRRSLYEFLGRIGKIEIQGCMSKDLEKILAQMNGHRSIKEIIRNTKSRFSEAEILNIIGTLSDLGAIADSRMLYQQFHVDSANPSSFGYALSNEEIAALGNEKPFPELSGKVIMLPNPSAKICSLLQGRSSHRSFSGKPMTRNCLSSLLSAMYGRKSHNSVPSAGGLYPMSLFVQVLAGVTGLEKGLYRYDAETHRIQFQKNIAAHKLYPIFDSVLLCDKASIVVMVVANLAHITQKYANRGYRYALIEAGHICQNGYLASIDEEIGVVEIGGYQDEPLANLLGLNYPNEVVLSTLFFGSKGKETSKEIGTYELNQLYSGMVKGIGLIKGLELVTSDCQKHARSAVAARCKYRINNRGSDYAFATGQTGSQAQFKAMVEAYERHSSSCARYDVKSPAGRLGEKWLDSRTYMPFRSSQMAEAMVPAPLSDKQTIEWVWGNRMKGGAKILVPVDMVYYPLRFETFNRQVIYRADSSGVAAHTDIKNATQNALLELIERDALMLHWYCDIKPRKMPLGIIPPAIRDSIECFQKVGIQVDFLDMTIDSVPVILVAIHNSKKKPYFITGAAAGMDYGSAAEKAFSEAESMWLSWIGVRIPKITAKEVDHPRDHAILYMRPDYQESLGDFLTAQEGGVRRVQKSNLLRQFDPIRVVIDNGNGPTGLAVVRVLSEHLLPINFGFGTESWKHKRIKSLGLHWVRKFPSQPHFFA